MHKNLLLIGFFISGIFLVQGCYYDVEEELYPANTVTCDTANVTYSGTVKSIIDANCNVCHSQASAQGGVVLDTYTTLKNFGTSGALTGTIRHESGYSAMPKDGNKLNDCNIAKIEKWVASGYPEN